MPLKKYGILKGKAIEVDQVRVRIRTIKSI